MHIRFLKVFLIGISIFLTSRIAASDFETDGSLFQDSVPANKTSRTSFFQNAPEPDKTRLGILTGTVLGLYPVSMYWLYTQWYRDYPQSGFHFFNDNNEWEKMDKYGHLWDAYSIAKPLCHSFRWAGLDNKRSTLYASGISFLYQTTIEVFDGFSAEWGFSGGDVIANTLGVSTFALQQLVWEEQRIVLKYSFHQTKYAKYRPDQLGSSLPENILKDYNGLTYWLNVNPHSWMKEESRFPKWLSIGFGFGAEGMTGGTENPKQVDGTDIPSFERYSQYYLSVDLDFSRVQFKSGFLNGFFKIINIIHLPAPAIEFSKGRKPAWHLLYF